MSPVLLILLSSIWMVLVWVGSLAFSNTLTGWRYVPSFWLTSILLLIIPPLITLFATHFYSYNGIAIEAFNSFEEPFAHISKIFSYTQFFYFLFGGLYFSGAFFYLWRLLSQNLALKSLEKSGKNICDFNIQYLLINRDIPPCSFGFRRPVILIPSSLKTTLTPKQLHLLLRHERAHITFSDPAFMTMLLVLKAILWPHPTIHDLIRRWQTAIEIRADDFALKGATSDLRKHYGQMLLTVLRKYKGGARPCPSATLNLTHLRSTKMRVKNIMTPNADGGKSRKQKYHIALIALLTGIVGTLTIGSFAETPKANKNPPQPLVRNPPIFPAKCVPNGGASSAKIILSHDIDALGRVRNINVVNSDNPCFNTAAINSLKGWKYPALQKGERKTDRKNVQIMIKFLTDEQWENKRH